MAAATPLVGLERSRVEPVQMVVTLHTKPALFHHSAVTAIGHFKKEDASKPSG